MSYKIYFEDLNTYLNEISQFDTQVSQKLSDETGKVQELVNLQSFTGAGADAIKNYFNEVHVACAQQIAYLSNEFVSAFAQHYRLLNDGVQEWNDHALLCQNELNNKSIWIKNSLKADLLGSSAEGGSSTVYKNLDNAKSSVAAAEENLVAPSIDGLKDALEELVTFLDDLDQTMVYQEDLGQQNFTSDASLFARLRDAISSFIDKCSAANFDISKYESGAVSQFAMESGLINIQDELVNYLTTQEANRIECCNFADQEVTNRELRRLEEERKNWETWQHVWEIAGCVIGVVATVAALAAIPATGGASLVALVGAGASFVGTFFDTVERISNLSLVGVSCAFGTTGKTYSIADNFMKPKGERAYGKGAGFGAVVAVAVGLGTGLAGDDMSNESKCGAKFSGYMAGMPADIKSAKAAESALKKGASVTSLVANAAQIVTDYGADDCSDKASAASDAYNKASDDCNKRKKEREETPRVYVNAFA